MSSFTDSLEGIAKLLWLALLGIAILGSWGFPVVYHFDTKGGWRRSKMGPHVMTFSLSVAVALTAYGSRVMFGSYPGRTAVMFFAMILLIVATWWRFSIYLKVMRREKKEARGSV